MYWTLTSSKFCISEITVEFAILRTLWTIDSKYLDKSGLLMDHVTMCTAGGRKLLFSEHSVYTPPTSYMLGGKLPRTVHPHSGLLCPHINQKDMTQKTTL